MAKKNTNTKRIIYPTIEQAAEYATDDNWKDYLKRFARGRGTRGVIMENDIIMFTNKQGEEFKYRLSPEPLEMYKQLVGFFTKHANMKKDKKRQRSRSRSLSPSIKKQTKNSASSSTIKKKQKDPWKSIKKKHLKTGLIYVYIDNLIKTHGLEQMGQRQLNHVLYTAELKGILHLCVEMKGGQISDIRCIKFDEEKQKFYIDSNVLSPKELKLLNSKSIIQIAPPSDPLKAIYPSKQLDPQKILDEQKVRRVKRETNNVVHSGAVLADENINPTDAS